MPSRPFASRSPAAVFGPPDLYPFARMLEAGRELLDDGPCELLVPWAGSPDLSKTRDGKPAGMFVPRDGAHDLAISGIAANGAFGPGTSLRLLVSGKVSCDIDANYLEHLWPAAFKLHVNVIVSRFDWLVVMAPGKAAVVLIGTEHRNLER